MDKRKFDRKGCLGVVYQKSDDGDIPIGYLADLSETGANLWIETALKLKENPFSIRLKSPDSVEEFDSLDLDVRPIWNSQSESNSYKIVGCEFIHLNADQKNGILKLVDMIDKGFSVK